MNIHSDHVPYLHREDSSYSQTNNPFIFVSPSWRVTCCHQNWPLTCQQWLSNTVAVASLHEPNQTNSLWVFNLNNWISEVWPLYIVGHDPVLSAHSVCACFLIVKTCRGTPSQKKLLHHHAAVSNFSHREQKHCESTLAPLCLWPKNSLLDFADSCYMVLRFFLSEVEVRVNRNTAIGSASCLKWNTWTPQRGMDPVGIHICKRLKDDAQ